MTDTRIVHLAISPRAARWLKAAVAAQDIEWQTPGPPEFFTSLAVEIDSQLESSGPEPTPEPDAKRIARKMAKSAAEAVA